eukprot:COSAG01_NODE_15488_length_1331_cov_2.632305_1_plen_180_part_00
MPIVRLSARRNTGPGAERGSLGTNQRIHALPNEGFESQSTAARLLLEHPSAMKSLHPGPRFCMKWIVSQVEDHREQICGQPLPSSSHPAYIHQSKRGFESESHGCTASVNVMLAADQTLQTVGPIRYHTKHAEPRPRSQHLPKVSERHIIFETQTPSNQTVVRCPMRVPRAGPAASPSH